MSDTAAIIGIRKHCLTTDGDGITTLVAFHGCPLRCRYCLNPQSLKEDAVCRTYDCELLYREVKCDELYFLATRGGITFGGGEPCLQSNFIKQFRKLCGKQWRITLETSLNVPQNHLETLLDVADNYIVDIKDMNNNIYECYTGKNNKQVVDNLRWLINHDKAEQIVVRLPKIQAYNTDDDIDKSFYLLKELGLSHFDRFVYKTPQIFTL